MQNVSAARSYSSMLYFYQNTMSWINLLVSVPPQGGSRAASAFGGAAVRAIKHSCTFYSIAVKPGSLFLLFLLFINQSFLSRSSSLLRSALLLCLPRSYACVCAFVGVQRRVCVCVSSLPSVLLQSLMSYIKSFLAGCHLQCLYSIK